MWAVIWAVFGACAGYSYGYYKGERGAIDNIIELAAKAGIRHNIKEKVEDVLKAMSETADYEMSNQ